MTHPLARAREVFAAASALFVVATAAAAQGAASASAGIVTVVSAAPFDSTLARLERAAAAKGLTVAAKIDHAAAAKRAGLTLRPTTLLIAGNPAASLPLHWTPEGLPVGVQLIGRYGDEASVLCASAQLERARPWFDRWPAIQT